MDVAESQNTSAKKIKAIIPFECFHKVFTPLCAGREYGCGSSEADWRLEQCLDGIREWWQRTNGEAQGLVHYEIIFEGAIQGSVWRYSTSGDRLRAHFVPDSRKSCREAYDLLAEMVRASFLGHVQK
jgi:hypothetical protein